MARAAGQPPKWLAPSAAAAAAAAVLLPPPPRWRLWRAAAVSASAYLDPLPPHTHTRPAPLQQPPRAAAAVAALLRGVTRGSAAGSRGSPLCDVQSQAEGEGGACLCHDGRLGETPPPKGMPHQAGGTQQTS